MNIWNSLFAIKPAQFSWFSTKVIPKGLLIFSKQIKLPPSRWLRKAQAPPIGMYSSNHFTLQKHPRLCNYLRMFLPERTFRHRSRHPLERIHCSGPREYRHVAASNLNRPPSVRHLTEPRGLVKRRGKQGAKISTSSLLDCDKLCHFKLFH